MSTPDVRLRCAICCVLLFFGFAGRALRSSLNLECGDSSPLTLAATDRGELERTDKSAREKAVQVAALQSLVCPEKVCMATSLPEDAYSSGENRGR